MNSIKDLNYVNNLLEEAQSAGYPMIYVIWGVIVLVGFSLLSIKPEWSVTYWIVSNIVGFIASVFIGMRSDSKVGQRNRELGKRYSQHFGIMGICIFIAMFAQDYRAILLITGLSYCLAGLYLERIMLIVGVITIASYIGVATGLITSNIVLGLTISAGLFAAAWATSKKNTSKGLI
jgi:hypothetical protein